MTALETGGDWRTRKNVVLPTPDSWHDHPDLVSSRYVSLCRPDGRPTAQWRDFQQREIQGNTTDCTYFKRNYCETWGQCCKRTERSKLLYEVDPTKTFKWQKYAWKATPEGGYVFALLSTRFKGKDKKRAIYTSVVWSTSQVRWMDRTPCLAGRGT